MTSLFQVIISFFETKIFNFNNAILWETTYSFQGYDISFAQWLSFTMALISLIFILVACVMFVVKMIKLVGNLVK